MRKAAQCRGLLLRMLQHGPCSKENVRRVAEARGIAEGLPAAMESLNITEWKIGGVPKLVLPCNVTGMFPKEVRGTVLRQAKAIQEVGC